MANTSFEVKAKDNGNTGSDLETIENERTAACQCRILVPGACYGRPA